MDIESVVNELNLKQMSELNALLRQKAEKMFEAEWKPKFRATNFRLIRFIEYTGTAGTSAIFHQRGQMQ